MKHLAVKAGLKIFIPTPPKISFPITIPNDVAIANCHRGIDGGIVSGIKAQVTKKPSDISCFRTIENSISQNAPVTNVTIMMGKMILNPKNRFSIHPLVIPSACAF